MNRLQGKDLINIGIFTAIYFIVIFAAASIGFIPIFIPLISVIVPLVGGIPMMLFFSKIHVKVNIFSMGKRKPDQRVMRSEIGFKIGRGCRV